MNTNIEKEICGCCKEEKVIVFECRFCQEGRMCEDCGREHRNWCSTKDDWVFLKKY